MTKATNRGPGWTGPAHAAGTGIDFQAKEALQRRAAQGRPCSWRGGCRRRACRRLTVTLTRARCRSDSSSRKRCYNVEKKSNGGFQAEGPGQNSADFSCTHKEAA
eukprot:5847929-Amphidinium_carterae.1